MKKKKLCAIFIATWIFFAGCASTMEHASSKSNSFIASNEQDISFSSTIDNDNQSVTDPAWDEEAVHNAYNKADLWQQAYYDTVVSELANNPYSLELYFLKQGEPLLAIDYGSLNGSQNHKYKSWYIKNGKVKLLFEGTSRWLTFNRDSGTLSLFDYEKWQEDNPDSGAESLIKDSGYKAYDGPDVLLSLTANFPSEMGQPTIKRRLADFFLDTYNPSIPEGAPEWVEEYVKYIYTHLDAPYMTKQPDFWHHGTIRRMTLYEAGPGAPPIIYGADGMAGECVSMGDRGRYTIYAISSLNGSILYTDRVGHRVIQLESSYTDWYVMRSAGWDQLFGEGGISPALPSMVYINAESAYFETGNEDKARDWLRPRREHAFTSNGIELELFPCEGILYELATTPATAYDETEITPWYEVEKKLIDAFCDFARKTGQMS